MTPTCPRCGKYQLTTRPAISRADNRTEVCPVCGTDEALLQFSSPDHTTQPVSDWPVSLLFEAEAVKANPSVPLA